MSTKIPETMMAVVTTGHGGLDKLDYRQVPVPKPAAGEVLVRVGACGLNNTDIWVREGAYGNEDDPAATTGWNREPMEFPRIQGADIAGTVVKVGADVSRPHVGERVIVNLNLYRWDNGGIGFWGYIGAQRDGGYAEYATVPAENAYAVHSPMTDAELATFPCAYLTAESMLDRAGVGKGETVLVTGASGGVGSALIQMCAVRGARVVAVAGRDKLDAVAALGAEWVVARDSGDLKSAVRDATGLEHVDVAADVVGGPDFPAVFGLIREEGRYVTAGAIAGPMVSLDLRSVYLRHRTIYGINAAHRSAFEAVHRCIESGQLKPILAKEFPLERIRDAQTAFLEKSFVGKIVVVPAHA